jgi:hypothetical protein
MITVAVLSIGVFVVTMICVIATVDYRAIQK